MCRVEKGLLLVSFFITVSIYTSIHRIPSYFTSHAPLLFALPSSTHVLIAFFHQPLQRHWQHSFWCQLVQDHPPSVNRSYLCPHVCMCMVEGTSPRLSHVNGHIVTNTKRVVNLMFGVSHGLKFPFSFYGRNIFSKCLSQHCLETPLLPHRPLKRPFATARW